MNKIKFSTLMSGTAITISLIEGTKKRASSWIKTGFGAITFNPQTKTIYLGTGTINKKKPADFHALLPVFVSAFGTQDMPIQINLDKAAKLFNADIKKMIRFFSHAFFLSGVKKLSYKNLSKKNDDKKKNPKKSSTKFLSLVKKTTATPTHRLIVAKQQLIVSAITQTQKWQDTPPNILNSTVFMEQIKASFKDIADVKLTIVETPELKKENCNLLLSVNAGSIHPAYIIIADYNPTKKSKSEVKHALIGKGVMFDSGGYSLKPSNYMTDMKFDMSGAAIVMSVLKLVAQFEGKNRIVAVAPLVTNLIDAKANTVDTVIIGKSGKSVEITNTDAEGRLILADAISYAIDKYKPESLITVATLTGAVTVALGDETTGVFACSDPFAHTLAAKFIATTTDQFELAWQLPIMKENREKITSSKLADLVNSAKSYTGGASNAAAFLAAFSEKLPLMHLDVAGSAVSGGRGTGVHVSSLALLLS